MISSECLLAQRSVVFCILEYSFFNYPHNLLPKKKHFPHMKTIKTTNSTKLVQIIFQCLICWFPVCWPSSTSYNIDYSQVMSSFDCYQPKLVHPAIKTWFSEKFSVRNSYKLLLTIQSTFSITYTNSEIKNLFYLNCIFLKLKQHHNPKIYFIFCLHYQ